MVLSMATMTRSYPTWMDADYTPNDIGPSERRNPIEMWDEFDDQEVNRLLETDENTPL